MPEETAAILPRVAIITSGYAGSGFATATQLARQGLSVAISARTRVEASLNRLEECGSPVCGGVLDVRDTGSVESFVADVERELGPVDILMNCSGIGTQQTVSQHDEAKWLEVIDTNLNGCFRMIKACMPGMISRKWGGS